MTKLYIAKNFSYCIFKAGYFSIISLTLYSAGQVSGELYPGMLIVNPSELINKVADMMENYDNYRKPLEKQMLQLKKFFSGERLYGSIK